MSKLIDNLSGFALGEKKSIKDAKSAVFDGAMKLLEEMKIDFDCDMPAFETATKSIRQRSDIPRLFDRAIPAFAKSFKAFCDKDPDFKEAVLDSISKIVFSCGGLDDCGPNKFKINKADKALIIEYNLRFIDLDDQRDGQLHEFLEKSL
jgi:hypothetical protein